MSALPVGPRQLTVMFCDIVGWTSFAQRTEPELLEELARRYRERCATIVIRHGGFIAQYLGDGVLSYFGYPVAHEDDAERAVRAAREVVNAEAASASHFEVHVGIATGRVVFGRAETAPSPASGASVLRIDADVSAFGHAPNLAARLLELGGPGAVIVSEETRRLCGATFEYRELGAHQLKGLADPVRAWQVLAEGDAPSRFHARHAVELTPLVNRQAELAELDRLWGLAGEGHGAAVLISGEPGVGKSRLVDEFCRRIAVKGGVRLRYFCAAHLQNSPLAPLIRQLPRVAGFSEHDDAAAKLEKLRRFFAASSLDANEVVPLLASLLSIPYEGVYPSLGMSPQRQRRRMFEAFIKLLDETAAARPVLFVVEDLHWIDPSSDELVGLVVEASRTRRVMVLITARPDYHPHWRGRENVMEMRLATLDRRDSVAMIEWLSRDRLLAPATMDAIAERSDGLPLFIEDLTRDVLEFSAMHEGSEGRAVADVRARGIPATLHDTLMSRLDRMGSAKHIAQSGAVLGREFSYRLLSFVADRTTEQLGEDIRRLVESGLFEPRPSTSVPTYAFRHALVRDAAYGSLLKKERQALHARVADVLEQEFPEIVEDQPDVLAHHLHMAGLVDRAVPLWIDAARLSARRSGFREAIAHLQGAVRLLASEPDGRPRWQLELRAYLVLGGIYAEYRGFSSPDCGQAYAHALALCERLGDAPQVFAAIAGVGSVEITRGNLVASRALAEKCLAMAERQSSRPPFVMGHLLLGGTLCLNGEFVSSRTHLDEALRLYEEDRQSRAGRQDRASRAGRQVLYVQDQKSTGLCYLALDLTFMGYLDDGLKAAQEGLAHARSLGAPHAENFSLVYLAGVHRFRREMEQALRVSTESLELARKQGYATWQGVSQLIRGEALVHVGSFDEGFAEIVAGHAAHREMGAASYQTFTAAVLAGGLLAAGRIDEAIKVLDDGMADGNLRNERFCFVELLRLKAEACRRRHERADAERWLLEAMALARQQQAKFFELRCAVDLCKLAGPARARSDVQQVLAVLCNWFGPTLDVPDLAEARALSASASS